MKITETVERECCQWPRDLKDYKGERPRGFPQPNSSKGKIWFCQYCGQLWHVDRKSGEMEAGLERIEITGWD